MYVNQIGTHLVSQCLMVAGKIIAVIVVAIIDHVFFLLTQGSCNVDSGAHNGWEGDPPGR